MRILVTGAAGFIGQHLVAELNAAGYDGYESDIVYGRRNQDLRDPNVVNAILDLNETDVVVHLAAQVGRLFGEDDLRHTIESNAAMTAIVARACGESGIRLCYAS